MVNEGLDVLSQFWFVALQLSSRLELKPVSNQFD